MQKMKGLNFEKKRTNFTGLETRRIHTQDSITVQNHTRICLWETRWHRNWLLVGRSGKWNNGVEDFYVPQLDDRDSPTFKYILVGSQS